MSSRRKPPPAAVANPTSTRKVIARTATRTTVPASGEPILPAQQRKVVKLRRRTGTAGSTSLPRSSTETRIKSSAEMADVTVKTESTASTSRIKVEEVAPISTSSSNRKDKEKERRERKEHKSISSSHHHPSSSKSSHRDRDRSERSDKTKDLKTSDDHLMSGSSGVAGRPIKKETPDEVSSSSYCNQYNQIHHTASQHQLTNGIKREYSPSNVKQEVGSQHRNCDKEQSSDKEKHSDKHSHKEKRDREKHKD